MSNLIGKKVVLTLKCSLISTVPKHRAFAQTLGLHKVGDKRECEYTAGVHGIAKRVPYLIDVQENEPSGMNQARPGSEPARAK